MGVSRVFVGGFNLPGTAAGCQWGSEKLLAAKRVRSGLVYRDPWLLPLLLPVFLACGEEPTHLLLVLRLGGCRREGDWTRDGFQSSLDLEGAPENTLEVLLVRQWGPRAPGRFLQGGQVLTHRGPVFSGLSVASKRDGGDLTCFQNFAFCLNSFVKSFSRSWVGSI